MKGALLIAGVTGTSWVVGTAVGSATANNTAALLEDSSVKVAKAGERKLEGRRRQPEPGSPKPNKAKAGKQKVRGPSIMARSEGELVLGLEWPPSCGLSEDEQCEAIFCNGLQAYLQDTLCDNPEDCKLVVVCDPKIPRRANRALQTTGEDRKFTFSISLLVECTTTPDCSNTVEEQTAAEAAMLTKYTTLQGITAQQLIDGVAAAIAQMSPPDPAGDFYSTFSFTFDQATAELSDPAIVVVPNDVPGPFEFVGEGFCKDSKGKSHPYIRADTILTLAECANWASAAAASDCWVQKQAFVGFQYNEGDCYPLFDLGEDFTVPSDACDIPADSDCDHSGSGTGPIVTVSSRQGVLCYKYVG
jgi:hypothetical protein